MSLMYQYRHGRIIYFFIYSPRSNNLFSYTVGRGNTRQNQIFCFLSRGDRKNDINLFIEKYTTFLFIYAQEYKQYCLESHVFVCRFGISPTCNFTN